MLSGEAVGRVGDVDAGAVVLGALGLGPVHGAEELVVGVDQVQAQGVLQEGDGLSAHGSADIENTVLVGDGPVAVHVAAGLYTRHAVACGLLADLAGVVAAIAISYMFF